MSQARDEAARTYRERQRAKNARTTRDTFARPLQFDESGFPIVERPPGFAERLARLLSVRRDADS